MGRDALIPYYVGAHSSREEKEGYLKSRGWFEWYNPDYWCHPELKPYGYCDATNWGVPFDIAFAWEYQGQPKYVRGHAKFKGY